MSPRRWREDAVRHLRRTGHFSSEAVLRTIIVTLPGTNLTFNRIKALSIKSSNLQNPSTRETPSFNNQKGTGKPVDSGLKLGSWNFAEVWSLEFEVFPSFPGYPVPCPFLTHSQVLENPRTATFPVWFRFRTWVTGM